MLKRARRKKGLSQKQLATRLHVSQSYISKIENSKADTVSIEFLIHLSIILNVCPVATFTCLTNCCSKCKLKCRFSLKNK